MCYAPQQTFSRKFILVKSWSCPVFSLFLTHTQTVFTGFCGSESQGELQETMLSELFLSPTVAGGKGGAADAHLLSDQ